MNISCLVLVETGDDSASFGVNNMFLSGLWVSQITTGKRYKNVKTTTFEKV